MHICDNLDCLNTSKNETAWNVFHISSVTVMSMIQTQDDTSDAIDSDGINFTLVT